MTLNDFLEKFGRTVLESPLATKAQEPPELAEIRLAVLDLAPKGAKHARGALARVSCSSLEIEVPIGGYEGCHDAHGLSQLTSGGRRPVRERQAHIATLEKGMWPKSSLWGPAP